jgi:N-acetyl-anhydromuramyl-L-alanine amidase AmpD
LWLAPVTFQTLAYVKQSAHFAVDYKQVWQLLPMYASLVQESYGTKGFNWEAINVEMAGIDFDRPGGQPPDSEVALTVQLVSRLMDHYRIAFAHVVGHYERDPRGDKRDPGETFMAGFRERLAAYRASLSPVKRRHLAGALES